MELLTRAEVAARLKLRPTKLWELTVQGRLPVVRIDRAVRYRLEDVEAFIAEHLEGAAK